MPAAGYRLRLALRRRWRGAFGLVVIGSLTVAAVITAVAGARRTSTTLDRARHAGQATDVSVNPVDDKPTPEWAYRKWAALPQVTASARVDGMELFPTRWPEQKRLDFAIKNLNLLAVDGRAWTTVDQPTVVAGRMVRQDRPGEVAINELARRRYGLKPGDNLDVLWADGSVVKECDDEACVLRISKPLTLHVTGVVRTLEDATRTSDDPLLKPQFLISAATRRADIAAPFGGIAVKLRHGAADVPAFERGVRAATPDIPVLFQESRLNEARIERSIRPDVQSLTLFAALAALAGGAVLLQSIVRQERIDGGDAALWSAIGSTRRELVLLAAARGAVIGATSAVIGSIIAIALSPMMPLGPMHDIEPRPGIDVDGRVVLLAVSIVVIASAFAAALAVARSLQQARARGRARLTSIGDSLANAGTSPAVANGVRLALDPGRGASAVPVQTAVLGVTIGIGALIASLVFGAGLRRFVDSPVRYGWGWTYAIYSNDTADADLRATLAKRSDVTGVREGWFGQVEHAGTSIALLGIETRDRGPGPVILHGRAPAAPDEVALGGKSMRDLGTRLGGRVTLGAQPTSASYRVVGQAVFPRLAPYPGSEPTGLGIGGAVTRAGLRRAGVAENVQTPFYLVSARGTATDAARWSKAVFGTDAFGPTVLGPQRPADVRGWSRAQRTPLVLSGLLALIAVVTFAHLLVTTVRRRRRDMAIMKTLGFVSRDVRRAIRWQSSTLAAVSLVVAVPAGIVIGRWLWSATARDLGVADDAKVPGPAIALVIAATFVMAVLVAWVPARRAARIAPAVELRSE